MRFRFPLENCGLECATPSAYVDIEPDSGLRDWNCGTNTYESHRGTDFGLVGGFAAQARGQWVLAAARGVVIDSHDGEPDRCTSGQCGGGGGLGNYLSILHADGHTSHYGHLKTYSIRVAIGQQISCGERIAQVGSSGNSTGPHLHFELRLGTTVTDPFAQRAACGAQSISYWTAQNSYRALPGTECEALPADAGDVSADVTPVPLDTWGPPVGDAASDAYEGDSGADRDTRSGSCHCSVRRQSPGRSLGTALMAFALIALLRRRVGRYSAASAQQRKPVE